MSDETPTERAAASEPGGASEPALGPPIAVGLVLAGLVVGWLAQGQYTATVTPAAPVPETSGGPATGGPHIFLVTFGNVRADHLPLYGYSRNTAPWISELARKSHVFAAASATSSWSLPSMMSLMTGMLPSQHGLEELAVVNGTTADFSALAAEATTLAERLKTVGYQTFAVVSNPLFMPESGFARGFDRFTNMGYTRASRVQLGVERMAGVVRRREQPTFVWVHYSDAHEPFAPSSPLLPVWEERPEQEGEGEYELGRLGTRELLARPDLREKGPALDHLVALYDSEIRLVDQHVQLLFGDFRISDQDVVVIASDHGEEFREHGELGHGRNLHEESVRVPLLVSWPAAWPEPSRIWDRVSLMDVFPTLAEVAGAKIPASDQLPARSLVPLIEKREGAVRDVPVVAELTRADGVRCRAVYEGAYNKVIYGERGRAEMFDLEEDAGEQADLAAANAGIVKQIVDAVDGWTASLPTLPVYVTSSEVTPLVAEHLAALGYAPPPADACP